MQPGKCYESMRGEPPIRDLHRRLRRLLRTFSKSEFNGFERCASLVWCHSFSGRLISVVLAALPERLPSLQYLHLSRFHAPSSNEQFPECPVLNSVHLSMNYPVLPQFWGTNFTQVTTLTISEDDQWVTNIAVTLPLFPAIQHLILYNFPHGYMCTGVTWDPDWTSGYAQEPESIQLLYLRTLKVSGSVPEGLLRKLDAPVLEELYIEAEYRGYTSLGSLHHYTRDFHCSRLYALLPPIIATLNPEWRIELETLANKCPRLEVVYVSGWMEPECKGILPRALRV
jgi:hypothetical protein